MRRQDLNTLPLKHESSPLTTRPGHDVNVIAFAWEIAFAHEIVFAYEIAFEK